VRNTDDNVWLEYRMPQVMVARRESSGSVGLQLARLGARSRLGALQAMLPGIPLEECARAMVLAPYSNEPILTPDGVFSDPWSRTRPELTEGTRAELLAMGREDLAEKVTEWEKEGDTYMQNRVRVSSELYPVAHNQVEASREAIAKSFADAPDLPLALLVMGHAFEMEGNLSAAEDYYRRALARPASDVYYDALLGMARLRLTRTDARGALAWCDRASARNPYLPNAFAIAAGIAAQMGEPDRARKYLELGLRYNPGDAELEEMLVQAPS
jgi:tetratricopeptide (TPR) repeat protein